MNQQIAPTYLECPSCGDEGAESDRHGIFVDGQRLICGCAGVVLVSEDEEPHISVDEDTP